MKIGYLQPKPWPHTRLYNQRALVLFWKSLGHKITIPYFVTYTEIDEALNLQSDILYLPKSWLVI